MSSPTTTNPITQTLTDVLSHLVQMPTITADTATNRAGLDWIEAQLAGLPLAMKHYEWNGHSSLVATTPAAGQGKNPKHPRLWLSAHLDVVPGAPAAFKPHVRDGRLYGRGTHDMKCAIAVYIALLKHLGPSLAQLDLGLMITTDEEIGGYDGVKRLLDDEGYRGTAAFMPDSGASWRQEAGSKGILWLDVTASGTPAHASRPWQGHNAIDALMTFVTHLRDHLVAEPCNDAAHAHTTLNFGLINGGTVANQVPDRATARLDMRVSPDNSLEEVLEWVETAKSRVPGITTATVLADPPYRVIDNGASQLFNRLANEAGYTLDEAINHGSSDARFFAIHNIPTINVSPTGSGFHVQHEWIDLADLTDYYDLTRQFVTEWCRLRP